MTVYTGRGDEGETDLFGGERVSKDNPRIEAYGTIDELNALIGRVRPTHYQDIDDQLAAIQNHLHVLQAELANPEADGGPGVDSDAVQALEAWIDDAESELEPLTSFILPGGSQAGAALHHARAVCRRAERRVVTLAASEPISPTVATYLNRLSDLLFVQGRRVNAREEVAEEHPSY